MIFQVCSSKVGCLWLFQSGSLGLQLQRLHSFAGVGVAALKWEDRTSTKLTTLDHNHNRQLPAAAFESKSDSESRGKKFVIIVIIIIGTVWFVGSELSVLQQKGAASAACSRMGPAIKREARSGQSCKLAASVQRQSVRQLAILGGWPSGKPCP